MIKYRIVKARYKIEKITREEWISSIGRWLLFGQFQILDLPKYESFDTQEQMETNIKERERDGGFKVIEKKFYPKGTLHPCNPANEYDHWTVKYTLTPRQFTGSILEERNRIKYPELYLQALKDLEKHRISLDEAKNIKI